jgi:hypothetical protein
MNRPDRPRPLKERVDGVLLLDKPVGISSNAALQRARRTLGAAKAGHTGTLDPLASGLLPLAFGESTKFSQSLLDADKAYEAVVRLGVTTTTGDAEGEVLETRPVAVTPAQICAIAERFHGEIEQLPPMYSALKHAGKPLYAYLHADRCGALRLVGPVQQGHLCSHPGGRHRACAGLWRASHRTAANGYRTLPHRRCRATGCGRGGGAGCTGIAPAGR